jgi:hypothetical protein
MVKSGEQGESGQRQQQAWLPGRGEALEQGMWIDDVAINPMASIRFVVGGGNLPGVEPAADHRECQQQQQQAAIAFQRAGDGLERVITTRK